MSLFTDILIQAACYGFAMLIPIGLIAILFKGFFFKYIRARASFGRLVLVKIRSSLRDHYALGKVEDGFLIYKANKEEKRLAIDDPSAFYKSLAVSWVDVDEVKNAIAKADYSTVPGFDAIKVNDLYVRALQRPAIAGTQDKIIMGLIALVGVLTLVSIGFGYLIFTQGKDLLPAINGVSSTCSALAEAAKGTIVGSATII